MQTYEELLVHLDEHLDSFEGWLVDNGSADSTAKQYRSLISSMIRLDDIRNTATFETALLKYNPRTKSHRKTAYRKYRKWLGDPLPKRNKKKQPKGVRYWATAERHLIKTLFNAMVQYIPSGKVNLETFDDVLFKAKVYWERYAKIKGIIEEATGDPADPTIMQQLVMQDEETLTQSIKDMLLAEQAKLND